MGLNLTAKRNASFEAVIFTMLVNGVAQDLTGSTIKMQIRKEPGGVAFTSLTSVGSAGITITTPTSGVFQINKQIFSIPAYSYVYDIQITYSDGTVKSYIDGAFNVLPNITE